MKVDLDMLLRVAGAARELDLAFARACADLATVIEAAFAEPPDPDPQDLAFARKLAEMSGPKPASDGTLSFQQACELAIKRTGEWVAERNVRDSSSRIKIKAIVDDEYFHFGVDNDDSWGSRVERDDITARWTPIVEVSK